MKKTLSVSMFALVAGLTVSAHGATNLPLPAAVAGGLQAASSAADVCALVRANPPLAATIMSEAAALGVASPAGVMSVCSDGLTIPELSALVSAGAEAAPAEADATAAAAFAASGAPAQVIQNAAEAGLRAAQPALSDEAFEAEALEIAAALNQAPDGDEIETADISPTGQLRRSFGRVPSFVNLPSEAQASPN